MYTRATYSTGNSDNDDNVVSPDFDNDPASISRQIGDSIAAPSFRIAHNDVCVRTEFFTGLAAHDRAMYRNVHDCGGLIGLNVAEKDNGGRNRFKGVRLGWS